MTYHRVNKQVSSLILWILKEPSLAQFQILKLFDIYFQYYDDINLKTSKDVQKWWEKCLSINEMSFYIIPTFMYYVHQAPQFTIHSWIVDNN